MIDASKRELDAGLDDESFGEAGFMSGAMTEIGADRSGKRFGIVVEKREQPSEAILAHRG